MKSRRNASLPFILPLLLAAAAAPGFLQGIPLPDALIRHETWDDPAFRSAWVPRVAATRISNRYWLRPPAVFGRKPHVISARFDGDRIQSITLLFLDSGTHFGYIPGERAIQTREQNQARFRALFEATIRDVQAGLILHAVSATGESGVLGTERLLRQRVILYELGDLTARLHAIPEQLIKVTLFPSRSAAITWRSAARNRFDNEDEWEARFASRVETAPNGDRLLNEVPVFPQGDRAYCGVSALAMAMQYLGLDLETEDYAAAAGIRYGSTKGSDILDVYRAAAYEAGMRLPRRTAFDFDLARQSIDAGLPVLVWRRWRQERDYLHTQFAKRLSRDPTVTLPEPDEADRELWPGEDDYNHASVVTGYHAERREVIFTESWGEGVRNRRMRVEEMEGTSYYSFYPAF